MKTAENYKNLISQLRNLLKPKNYVLKGSCFHIRGDNNWGCLDFQKSSKSTAKQGVFTINVGICSAKLLSFFDPDISMPRIEDCHWRERIGFLLPERYDKWWNIQEDKNFDEDLFREIQEVVFQTALPAISKHISDEMLIKEWASGRSPGLTDFQRLVNLIVLLKTSDSGHAFMPYVEELKQMVKDNPILSVDYVFKRLSIP